MEEFLSKVELLNKTVKDICEDKATEDQIKETEQKLGMQTLKKSKQYFGDNWIEKKVKPVVKERKGPGTKENYKYYCRRCQIEFLDDIKMCTRCKSPTQSCKERIQELKQLVEEFKRKRQKKKEKIEKFKLIKETEKITKSSRYTEDHYNKWDYFTDEEDSAEELMKQTPQVPENDPNFKALELDMKKRKRRKEEERKQGMLKKDEGNKYFKKGKLEFAEMKYSEGIEIDKSNKALWLNRALVRMKLGKWEDSVEDCTRMIEYMEYIEEGFVISFPSAIKAFLRRAKSHWKLKEFEKATEDINKLKELLKDKKDKEKEREELLKLEQEIQKERKIQKIVKGEEGKQVKPIGKIQERNNNF
jgi:tetratricopeptide (TPR) repeat protein